jgi:hypothetical protein
LRLVPAPVVKLVVPLINSGAVVAREPKVYDPFAIPGRAIEEAMPRLGAILRLQRLAADRVLNTGFWHFDGHQAQAIAAMLTQASG